MEIVSFLPSEFGSLAKQLVRPLRGKSFRWLPSVRERERERESEREKEREREREREREAGSDD